MSDRWIDACKEELGCCTLCHSDWIELGYNLNETYLKHNEKSYVFTNCCMQSEPTAKEMHELIKGREEYLNEKMDGEIDAF